MTAHFLVEMRVIATIDFPYAGMLRNEMENERESKMKKELQGCDMYYSSHYNSILISTLLRNNY